MNMSKPTLSICIPTYNRAEKLEICINSIFSQIGRDENIEVLVINNASTDKTEEVILKYARTYNNLRYIKNDTNIGGDRNIYKASEEARGKYIFLHGDDDIFLTNTIYVILYAIINNPTCGVFFVNVLNDNKEVKILNGMGNYLRETSIYSTFISSLIFNREEYLKLKDRDLFLEKNFNQVYLQYSIIKNNSQFCIINNSIFYYLGSLNMSPEVSWANIFVKNYIDVINHFKDKGLTKEEISIDKKRALEQVIIPRYSLALRKLISINISDFEEIFVEYYKEEPYFESSYALIKELQKQYII